MSSVVTNSALVLNEDSQDSIDVVTQILRIAEIPNKEC